MTTTLSIELLRSPEASLFLNFMKKTAWLLSEKYPINYTVAEQAITELGLVRLNNQEALPLGVEEYKLPKAPLSPTFYEKHRLIKLAQAGETLEYLIDLFGWSAEYIKSVASDALKEGKRRRICLEYKIMSKYYEDLLKDCD